MADKPQTVANLEDGSLRWNESGDRVELKQDLAARSSKPIRMQRRGQRGRERETGASFTYRRREAAGVTKSRSRHEWSRE